MNGEQLVRVDEYKYLGIIFNKNLNWHNHIDKMCAKFSQRLGLLQRTKFCMPNVTLTMLYNTLVLPLIDYGNIIYRTTNQTYLTRLQILQNKDTCVLLNCHYTTHIMDMLTELTGLQLKNEQICTLHA